MQQTHCKAFDRALAIGAPIAGLLIFIDLIQAVLRSVATWEWNDVRMARGIALRYGYPLYPGRDAAVPIIGTMHGPVPHLLYSCLVFLKNPTQLLIAGCVLSSVLYFGAVLWLHLRTRSKIAGVYGFLACTALVLASPGASYAAVSVHVDACAMCCAMLAAGLLVRREPLRSSTLAASAVLAMLAVASKQTMAPVAIALPCFVLLADGKRAFARYLAWQVGAAATIFAAMLAVFRPPRDLLFNTFTLSIQQPRTASITARILVGLYQLRLDLAAAVAPLVLLIAVFAWAPGNIRQKIVKHPWLVFLLLAAIQLPIELRAWSTDGGDQNHLGVVTLFVALAATRGLVDLWNSEPPMARDWAGVAARALLLGIFVAKTPLPFEIRRDIQLVGTNSTQTAYNYERQHPGRAYFPINPLAALLAEGKLTHLDPALFDRELAGFPISREQFAAGLPTKFELVAYPKGRGPKAEILRDLLQGTLLVDEPGLEGWRVYRVKPSATQLTSASQP